MEPDHSGEIETSLRRYPSVKLVANKQTRKIMEGYFGDVSANFMEVGDGDKLELGKHTLHFYLTPWVHWPETMMTYEATEKILFSADAFGTFGVTDGAATDALTDVEVYEEEMRRYYSNIVGKYGMMVQKALAKLSGLDVKTLCPLHGPVWSRQAGEVIGLYDTWSRGAADTSPVIIYASMYKHPAPLPHPTSEPHPSHGPKRTRPTHYTKHQII